ncbi:uncharacterized protein LOC126474227 [Schistocerca serialis cubense]|uniref:uncharacterized protein LOC126474227 n=1 Tax=Schistocerca serialis cubense TaxID=2023355 RepID=UPI00214E282E|nr:uncharacterized protein LOC126474227 [Schistocerca serialis cubense]
MAERRSGASGAAAAVCCGVHFRRAGAASAVDSVEAAVSDPGRRRRRAAARAPDTTTAASAAALQVCVLARRRRAGSRSDTGETTTRGPAVYGRCYVTRSTLEPLNGISARRDTDVNAATVRVAVPKDSLDSPVCLLFSPNVIPVTRSY